LSQVTDPSGPSSHSTPTSSALDTIPDAFRAVAARNPDRIAYQDRHRSVTYAQLDRDTNAVANALLHVLDDRPVVVVAPVSIDSLTLIHGALKAGRLVAPLDPRWPVEQWVEVVRRLDGRLVVPDDATRDSLPPAVAATTLVAADLRDGATTTPAVELDPDGPALVFFTSGSTGAPKGTLVGHGMPLRALDMFSDIGVDDHVALLAPLSFITGAVTAIGVGLTGGTGHVFDAASEDLSTLPDWLDEQRITLLGLTVSLVALLAGTVNAAGRTLGSLRYVGLGGEHGSADDFAQALRAFPNAQLRHIYGMTETGGVSDPAITAADARGDGPMPVGRPWSWVRVDIVDDDGQPVPDGEAGEIWATGRHVAFGYWDEPALTAERFVHHADGTRTVRTGDLGRFRADGMLEVLGRSDRRVKVNGQLVDLSLVELEVELLPQVRDAVVSSVPTDDGGHRVVAHVALDAPVTVGELRRGLAGRLPPYAIPRAFFRVDEVPHTVNGKVDRVWLRESAVGALPLETEYVAPRDDRERAVAALFEEVLAVERVGVHDDFFELGGDSLAAVELVAGLAEDLRLDLAPSELLDDATVAGIARRLQVPRASRADQLVRVNRGDGPAVACVPGGANGPLQLRPLGRRLPDVDLRAFGYNGMDHRALPDRSVTAIARRNLRALRASVPRGPYRLLGYSFGGNVALEMATQLVTAGDEVELLVLIEPPLPIEYSSFLDRGVARTRRVTAGGNAGTGSPHDPLGVWLDRAGSLARYVADSTRSRARLATAGIVRRHGVAQHDLFFLLQSRIVRKHRPPPYGGTTALLGSARYLAKVAPVADRLLPRADAGGRRIDVELAAFHGDLLREPNVAEVARVLDGLLVADPARPA
jgi:amino acid adenylation domain-containing protein